MNAEQSSKRTIKAETNLGIMHANGKGVTQNFAEARKWFQRAADHGEVKAQSNLGALYATAEACRRAIWKLPNGKVSPPSAATKLLDLSLKKFG